MRSEPAAWSWAEHLRQGGTRPWSAWTGEAAAPGSPATGHPPAGWVPPAAAQLELVRLLAARPAAGPLVRSGRFPRLADVVLGRSAPGRGLAAAPLRWPHDDGPRVGAPPVDPADLPVAELVRAGVGVLAELLVRASTGPQGRGRIGRPSARAARPALRRPSATAFQLCGPPVTTAAVRRTLAGSGHREGGRDPRVVLLAPPLDLALVQVWSARVQDGAPVRWRGFLDRSARRPGLPPSADYAALARGWAQRVGPGSVHVLVAPDPSDPSQGSAGRAVADLLGLRLRPGAHGRHLPGEPRELSAAGVDAVRRVSRILGVRLRQDRHRDAVRRLLEVLDRPGPHLLTVPPRHRPWLEEHAARVAEGLRSGGYAVHGDPAGVLPAGAAPSGPRRHDVLEVVLDACLALADPQAGAREAEQR